MTARFFINLGLDSPDRFDMGRFLDFSEEVFDPLTSYTLTELPNLPVRGEVRVLSPQRPDLLAFQVYGNVNLWWVLMAYNGLISVEEVTAGLILPYPSEEDVSSLIFRLRSIERSR